VCETSNDWDERVSRLRKEKHEIGLPLAEVREVDDYLDREWDIKHVTPESWQERLFALPHALQSEFIGVLDQRSELSFNEQVIPAELEKRFYDLMSNHSINGLMHSQKHVFILGGLVWVTAVIKRLGIHGTLLDIGCHTGYQTRWYAEKLGLRVTGADFSCGAIRNAKRYSAEIPNLDFHEWDINTPCPLEEKFDVVVCSDVITESRVSVPLLEIVSTCLKDNGIFMCLGNMTSIGNASSLQQEARDHGFQYGIADVIGGNTGAEWDSRPAILFTKAPKTAIPDDILRVSSTGWDEAGFPIYANSHSIEKEKSIAYFRAYNTEKSEKGRS